MTDVATNEILRQSFKTDAAPCVAHNALYCLIKPLYGQSI